jgi:DNA replication protein DnaC
MPADDKCLGLAYQSQGSGPLYVKYCYGSSLATIVSSSAMVASDLVIIDDLMFMAIDRHEANLFFQLINKLYGQTSIIITSNKKPEDWGDILGDPAITTAILDRLIHKSEVIHLTGDSYRIKHRQTIFGNN